MESAGYVARYCMKKITGAQAPGHYQRVDIETGEVHEVVPEFSRMSLKPGIGRPWLDKYHRDVYPHDRVVVQGMKLRPPRYYDIYLAEQEGYESDEVQFERYKKSLRFKDDCTPERLADAEHCAKARLSFKKRSLE